MLVNQCCNSLGNVVIEIKSPGHMREDKNAVLDQRNIGKLTTLEVIREAKGGTEEDPEHL